MRALVARETTSKQKKTTSGQGGAAMIAGYPLIWTAYGWWLPNDPRGSSSHEIRVERIADLGELHHGRKPVHPPGSEVRAFYEQARHVLTHELLTYPVEDFSLIASSIGRVIEQQGYTCYACAVMPEHVHLLIRRHRDFAEQMLMLFQLATQELLIGARHRPPSHPAWGGPGWKVFLNTREDMERTVRYIEANPRKAHLPAQRWGFVRPYDGWHPHRSS
jgi:REP element-mobilizing transposase RayT